MYGLQVDDINFIGALAISTFLGSTLITSSWGYRLLLEQEQTQQNQQQIIQLLER